MKQEYVKENTHFSCFSAASLAGLLFFCFISITQSIASTGGGKGGTTSLSGFPADSGGSDGSEELAGEVADRLKQVALSLAPPSLPLHEKPLHEKPLRERLLQKARKVTPAEPDEKLSAYTLRRDGIVKMIPALGQKALGQDVCIEDSLYMRAMKAASLHHTNVGNSHIMLLLRADEATYKQSYFFHSGLLALYEIIESYVDELSPALDVALIKRLSATKRLKADVASMTTKDGPPDTDPKDLEAFKTYKKYLKTIASDSAKLMAHFFIHIAGTLAGGQRLKGSDIPDKNGKQQLRFLHDPSELTHYDFGTKEESKVLLYQLIRAFESVSEVHPDQVEEVIEEFMIAFYLSDQLYKELYKPVDPMNFPD